MIDRELNKLNALMYEKIEDSDNLNPFYTIEKDEDEFSLFVNVGKEKFVIYIATTMIELDAYIKGMLRGLNVERKPVWKM